VVSFLVGLAPETGQLQRHSDFHIDLLRRILNLGGVSIKRAPLADCGEYTSKRQVLSKKLLTDSLPHVTHHFTPVRIAENRLLKRIAFRVR
jgi:hypothetical protein